MKIETVIEQIQQAWPDTKGCSTIEISDLEDRIGRQLPEDYKYMLSRIGKRAGSFMIGSEFYYDSLLLIQSYGRKLVLKNQEFTKTLDENCFIFWFHQGYTFLFFKLNEGPNPPVYYYTETEDGETSVKWKDFKRVSDTFSQYLSREVESHLQTKNNN